MHKLAFITAKLDGDDCILTLCLADLIVVSRNEYCVKFSVTVKNLFSKLDGCERHLKNFFFVCTLTDTAFIACL